MLGNRRLRRIRGRHHVVVAYLALFLALGGSAMAAKPLLDGSDVKDESLTGADIQNDTLTGEDILESAIEQVPSARTAGHATTAGDADTLDGIAAGSYLKNGDVAAGDLSGQYPNPQLAPPEAWHEIAPGSGCGPTIVGRFCSAGLTNFGEGANSVAYFKDPFGIVHLKGTVKNAATTGATGLFYVPEEYRPAGHGAYAVAKGDELAIVDVFSDGEVAIVSSQLAQGQAVSLDGLSWRAE